MAFFSNIALFLIYVFVRNLATKDRSLIFWIEKNGFWTGIVKFKKSPTNQKFAKGLVQGFCQKMALFLIAVFVGNLATKCHFFIFWIQKDPFSTGIVNFEKSKKNREFSKGLVHDFLQKVSIFLTAVFVGNLATKNRFFWYSG